jgi:hypothetical protein
MIRSLIAGTVTAAAVVTALLGLGATAQAAADSTTGTVVTAAGSDPWDSNPWD